MPRVVEVRESEGTHFLEEGLAGVAKIERKERGVEVRFDVGEWRFYPWTSVVFLGGYKVKHG